MSFKEAGPRTVRIPEQTPELRAQTAEKISQFIDVLEEGSPLSDPVPPFTTVSIASDQYAAGLSPVSEIKAFPFHNLFYYHIHSTGRVFEFDLDDPVVKEFPRVFRDMGATEVELDCTYGTTKKSFDTYWTGYWLADPIMLIYHNRIHPPIIETVKDLVGDYEGENPLKWVDLFSGDGSLVQKFRISTESAVEVEQHLVDRNETAIEFAKNRFEGDDVGVVIHDPIDIVEEGGLVDDILAGSHIVTASGGFNEGVLQTDEAESLLDRVVRNLEPGGFLISTGFSPSLFTASDFEEFGFNVHQISIPQQLADHSHPGQFYILQKKST